MHTSALSRPRNRLFTAVLAALLAVPLLVVTAPPAAADDPTYSLTWTNAAGDASWAGVDTIARSSWSGSATLVRTISNVTDPLEDVWDEVLLVSGTTAALSCEDFPDTITSETEATCTMDADFDALDTVLEFEGTLHHDSTTGPTATATVLRMVAGEVTVLDQPLPIDVEVGDDVEVNFEFTNVGSAPIEIGPVRMYNSASSYITGTCVDDSDDPLWQYGPIEMGETATATCEFGPMQQDTESRLVVQSTSFLPPPSGIAPNIPDVVNVLLDDPSVEIVATADPDTLMNGGAADVEVTVDNTSDIIFDELRMSIATDAGEVCAEVADDPFDGGDTWEPSSACSVEPAAGDATTVTVELDYETGDGTQTHTPDPVVVDLASESTGLAVDARAGVVNQTVTPPSFVLRSMLPLQPDPNYHLGGPAALEVTVSNPGTIDLVDVDVAADVAGCDRTFDIDAGDEETYTCEGPELSPGEATATTTVTASADVDGTSLQATDTADFSAFGISADVTIDPDWDGVDLALPFLITIENVGAHELEWNGAAWQVQDQFGNWWDAPADTCSVASGDEFAPPADQTPLPVHDSVTHDGCTLLAGDLVDGLSVRAAGVQDAWGEGPGSYDVVELQFDPDGAVHGVAELNGDAFGDVDVELRLLELLELPRTEPEDLGAHALMAAGDASTEVLSGASRDCMAVGDLSADDEGDIVATVTSDADGGFCFEQVPPGTYEVVVDTDVDADLDELVVDGTAGFTTNSPATSEPFFVGFASAMLGDVVQVSLTFSSDTPVEAADDPEPIAADSDDEELAATGSGTTGLTAGALLTLLLGVAFLLGSRRLVSRSTRGATAKLDHG